MHDDVIGIDQDPICCGQALNPGNSPESLLDPVRKLVRHRRHLPCRAAGRDHHMIGDVRFPRERDRDDVYRLIVVEGAEHEIVQGFNRMVFATVGFAGRSGLRCGQWSSFT